MNSDMGGYGEIINSGGGDDCGWGNDTSAQAAYQPQENAAWGSEPPQVVSAEPTADWGGSNW